MTAPAFQHRMVIDPGDPAAPQLHFDPVRSHAGGEDSVFFTDFPTAVGQIAFMPAVMTHETMSADCARLLRRRYRMGRTHAGLIAGGRSRVRRIQTAGYVLHLGAVAQLGGSRQAEIYGTVPDGSNPDPRSGRKEN